MEKGYYSMRTLPICCLPLQKSQLSNVLEVMDCEVPYALKNSCQGEADEGLGAPVRNDYLD